MAVCVFVWLLHCWYPDSAIASSKCGHDPDPRTRTGRDKWMSCKRTGPDSGVAGSLPCAPPLCPVRMVSLPYVRTRNRGWPNCGSSASVVALSEGVGVGDVHVAAGAIDETFTLPCSQGLVEGLTADP